jgi:hypothetical protein
MTVGPVTAILYVKAYMNLFPTFHISGPIWENFGMGEHQIMSKSSYDFHVKSFMEAILYVRAYTKRCPFCYISFPVWMKFGRGDAVHKD